MATKPMPNEELVEVFGAKEESEAMVVSGLLESAGIDCMITATEAPQDVLPGVGDTVVKVSADDAEEARRIIEEALAGGELSADNELSSGEEEEPA
ncbi:MAG: putative signal transducing protein [Terriglobales bacterium]